MQDSVAVVVIIIVVLDLHALISYLHLPYRVDTTSSLLNIKEYMDRFFISERCIWCKMAGHSSTYADSYAESFLFSKQDLDDDDRE